MAKNVTFAEVKAAFGDGDEKRGHALLGEIVARLKHAREKHVWHGIPHDKAMGAVIGETTEFVSAAVKKEGEDREHDEALDVIATAVRFSGREWQTQE